MRIKRLEIVGFKSCKDRAVLDFPRGVTGVVGPNGCGKSNIVDALRWVLGEQSAKHLRGQSMEDVIFAGNDRYGPLGVAEVTITFDNDGKLPHIQEDDPSDEPSVAAVLRETPEIEITRRLFRSGESEYLINGRSCRLRDITELFLGTGVGTKAYSIIEQGRVGVIVGAKPEEIRLFIEEAAGTTLFRSRKEAAERKIERTRENLFRANDIVQELERQANSLRRQAKGAVRYSELRQQELDLDRRLSAHRLRRLDQHTERLVGQVNELTERQDALKGAQTALQRDLGDARERQRLVERAAEENRRHLYERRGRLTELEQERRYLESRIGELRRLCEEARTEIAEVHTKLRYRTMEEAEVRLEQDSLVVSLDVATSARAVAEQTLGEVEAALLALNKRLEEERRRTSDFLSRQASLRNEISSVARHRDGNEKRRLRLRQESDSLGLLVRRLFSDIEGCQSRLDALLAELEAAATGKKSAAIRLSESLTKKTEAARRAESLHTEHVAIRSRFEFLRELNNNFEGFGDGVRSFMSNGGRERTGATGVVADVLDIEPGYERAVAAALHERLQYVVVPDADAGMAGACYLRETEAGRAGFVPRALRAISRGVPTHAPAGHSMLSEHVRVDEAYREMVTRLLEGVVVADSLEIATRQWKLNGTYVTFVTRDGESLDPLGIITGGSGDPGDAALLARKSELRDLEGALALAGARSDDASNECGRVMQEAETVATDLDRLDQDLHGLTVQRVSSQGDVELHCQNLVRTEERARNVDTELCLLAEEESVLAEREATAQADLAEALAALAQQEQRRLEQETEKAQLEASKEENRRIVQTLRLEEATLCQRREGCELRVQAARLTCEELAAREGVLAARLDRDGAELTALEGRYSDPTTSIEQASGDLARAQMDSERASAEAEALRGQAESLEREFRSNGDEADILREQRSRIELTLKESVLERSMVEDSVRERFGSNADTLLQSIAECEEDAGSLELQIEERRNAIRKLGAVNVGAIAELEEIEGRVREIIGQRDDLERSIDDLRGTIARLNRMSRERFKETFDAVNAVFQETFPKLFQGGNAWLALTDESNLLETGVEIFVRPPGKKVGNLNLLSGGEKALTAVSLIFSLFLYKPSPFCVLDEVDASLDDANIGRFARMVTGMADRSQFVLITHNKRTMEGCDMLYGVTMQEPGVSKIVSVQLD